MRTIILLLLLAVCGLLGGCGDKEYRNCPNDGEKLEIIERRRLFMKADVYRRTCPKCVYRDICDVYEVLSSTK
jgi:hypothetical protein